MQEVAWKTIKDSRTHDKKCSRLNSIPTGKFVEYYEKNAARRSDRRKNRTECQDIGNEKYDIF